MFGNISTRMYYILSCVILLVINGCATTRSDAEPAEAQQQMMVGVNTHFAQGKGIVSENLNMIADAGVTHIRDIVRWADVEKSPGEYALPSMPFLDAACERQLNVMLVLAYGNPLYENGDKPTKQATYDAYARYAEYVVGQLRGKVRIYDLWNEWENKIGGRLITRRGSAADYIQLLKTTYPKIKQANPDAVVLGAVLTGKALWEWDYVQQLLDLGLLDYCDGVAVHPYVYHGKHADGDRTPEGLMQWMQQVQNRLRQANHDQPVDMYLDEIGWPNYVHANGTPYEQAADYLARTYLLARTMPTIRMINWYDFQDDGWLDTTNESNFGIVRPDLTPKPAYDALKSIAGLASHGTLLGRLDVGDPNVWVMQFKHHGQDTWAIWSSHPQDHWQLILQNDQASPKAIELQAVGQSAIQRQWVHRAWAVEKNKRNTSAIQVQGQLAITVSGRPWLLRGNLQQVSVKQIIHRPFAPIK